MARAAPSLRRRLDALTVLVVVLLAGIAALLATAVLSLNSALDVSNNVLEPASRQAAILSTALIDQETGQRGYLITGQDVFLDPYTKGRQHEATAAARLRDLLADRPALRRDLAEVQARSAAWHRQAADPEIAATRKGDAGQADQLTSVDFGRQLFDQVRVALDRLQDGLRDARATGDARLQSAQHRLEIALAVSVGLALAVLVLSRRYFVRWIERPVSALSAAVQGARAGGPGIETAAGTPPELAALGAGVERMRARLTEQIEAVASANEALRQQGPAVLALREQLEAEPADVPGLLVAARLEPAEGVLAGDWYDVLDLGDGRWAAVLVDVSGHGAGAGTLALRLKALIRPAVAGERDVGAAFGWLARHLGDWGESFATAAVVVGAVGTDLLRYAAAGHPPALLCHDGAVERLDCTGPLLASVTTDLGWTQRAVALPPGARLVLYTDGIVESRNPDAREYGTARLADVLLAAHRDRADATALVDRVLADVREFSPGRARDDRTLVVLERAGVRSAAPVVPAPVTAAERQQEAEGAP